MDYRGLFSPMKAGISGIAAITKLAAWGLAVRLSHMRQEAQTTLVSLAPLSLHLAQNFSLLPRMKLCWLNSFNLRVAWKK